MNDVEIGLFLNYIQAGDGFPMLGEGYRRLVFTARLAGYMEKRFKCFRWLNSLMSC